MKYARPSDYAQGAATTAFGPALMMLWERVAPSYVGRGGFAPIMRLTGVISLGAGFLVLYQQSARQLTVKRLNSSTIMADCVRFPTSTLLWIHREQTRVRHGYAGDGR